MLAPCHQGGRALQRLGRGGLRAARPRREEAVHGGPGGAAQVGDPRPADLVVHHLPRAGHEPELRREAGRYHGPARRRGRVPRSQRLPGRLQHGHHVAVVGQLRQVGRAGAAAVHGQPARAHHEAAHRWGSAPRHRVDGGLGGSGGRAAAAGAERGHHLGVLAGAAVRARGARRGVRRHRGDRVLLHRAAQEHGQLQHVAAVHGLRSGQPGRRPHREGGPGGEHARGKNGLARRRLERRALRLLLLAAHGLRRRELCVLRLVLLGVWRGGEERGVGRGGQHGAALVLY